MMATSEIRTSEQKSNGETMPPNLNKTEKLFAKYSSKPFNPKLAQVFFKSGMIEV
jgi:ATP-dependent DNA helicase RecG